MLNISTNILLRGSRGTK